MCLGMGAERSYTTAGSGKWGPEWGRRCPPRLFRKSGDRGRGEEKAEGGGGGACSGVLTRERGSFIARVTKAATRQHAAAARDWHRMLRGGEEDPPCVTMAASTLSPLLERSRLTMACGSWRGEEQWSHDRRGSRGLQRRLVLGGVVVEEVDTCDLMMGR